MKKKKILIGLLVLITALVLAACGENEETTPNENAENESDSHGNIGKTDNIKKLVQDYSTDKITDGSASITSRELIVSNEDSSKTTYSLPKDEFFVSIAPYIETTHPCATHSLTGCQGELVNEEFDVYIEDTEGNVIIDQTMESQSNGFIDLWVPRDKTYKVTIAYAENTVESEFSTYDNDNTCITTMQLM
jgi:hypothetical protein